MSTGKCIKTLFSFDFHKLNIVIKSIFKMHMKILMWFMYSYVCWVFFSIELISMLNNRMIKLSIKPKHLLKQHKLLPPFTWVYVRSSGNVWKVITNSLKMYIFLLLGASKSLRYKHDFIIFNFAVNIKFIKRNIECLLGIPRCFVISVTSL